MKIDGVRFPWDEVGELIEQLTEAGSTPAEAIEAAARWLMDTVDWRLVFPGPVGAVLEAADDRAIGLAKVVIKLVLRTKRFRKQTAADLGN